MQENYRDVLTPHVGEMTELKKLLTDIELRVSESENTGIDETALSLVDIDGENQFDAEKIRNMSEKHLDKKTHEPYGAVEISYGTIAEYLGVSYYQATFGDNNIDLIRHNYFLVSLAFPQLR